MRASLILMVAILCASCMSGKIPCPEPKYTKAKKSTIHRRFMESSSSLSADAESNTSQNRVPKNTVRTISNVSVEEWDCPKPGKKKYLPKEVKNNIRKNMEKIKSKDQEEKTAAETSTGTH